MKKGTGFILEPYEGKTLATFYFNVSWLNCLAGRIGEDWAGGGGGGGGAAAGWAITVWCCKAVQYTVKPLIMDILKEAKPSSNKG